MFEFFKKKPESKKEENKLASINLFMNGGSEQVIVDILLNDYDSESIESLSNILQICMSKEFPEDLLNIVYKNLSEQGEEECILELISHLKNNKSNTEQKPAPIIKPSKMRM